MWHSHLNDMEIPETKRFIPKGFELGTVEPRLTTTPFTRPPRHYGHILSKQT